METVDNQKWKHTGINNYYVSKTGKIKNYNTNLILKTSINNTKSYERVELRDGRIRYHCSVHRLVALAFLPNPENKPEVHHKDECKTNNDVSNLEWVTPSENVNYSIRIWREKAKKKRVEMRTRNNHFITSFNSIREAGRETGIHSSCISRAASKKQKTANGFIWNYID